MYSIGIFANISELTSFPFANIKTFAETKFTESGRKNFEYNLYTKEQKELFLARVASCDFDGIVFATNVAHDTAIQSYFEDNSSAFSTFLNGDRGILVLLQYKLTSADASFNLFSQKDFPGLEKTPIKTLQNNGNDGNAVPFDEKKIHCRDGEIIFKYPKDVLTEDKDKKTNLFYGAMKDNLWQRKETPTPLFALISSYPAEDFRSIIDYSPDEKDEQSKKESFCIISRNNKKRVIITTLALDLENNLLLENMISYISRGAPTVYFKECGSCDNECQFKELLYNTKIHFSDEESIKPYVKYVMLPCQQKVDSADTGTTKESIVPIRQLKALDDNTGCIIKSTNVSSIQYMCKAGAIFLSSKLKDGKYDSLIGTLMTLKFFDKIGYGISKEDISEINGYLTKHHKEEKKGKEVQGTFDSIRMPTFYAQQIVELLRNKFSTNPEEVGFPEFEALNKEDMSRKVTIQEINCERNINDITRKISDDEFNFVFETKDKEPYDEALCIDFLLKIFAQILAMRDVKGISWENDCYMTAVMLITLLKIEDWFKAYDKNHDTKYVSKINTIAAYYEESVEETLYYALVDATDSERKKSIELTNDLLKKNDEYEALKSINKKLEDRNQDFDNLEKKNQKHLITFIIVCSVLVSAIVGLILYFLGLNGNSELLNFLLGFSPIEIIFALASLIVVPITLGNIFWKSNKKKSRRKKTKNKSKTNTSTDHKNIIRRTIDWLKAKRKETQQK